MSQEKKLLGILKGIAPYSNRGLNHEALAHLLDTDIGSIRSLISSLRNKKQEIGVIDDQYESIKSNRLKNYVFYTEEGGSSHFSEKKDHEWVPLHKCLKMIKRGIIADSLSIIAIMTYKLNHGA